MAEELSTVEGKKEESSLPPSSFPKSRRLRKREEYKFFLKTSQRKFGKYISLDFRNDSVGKLGITAPRKFGKSHERNRFKRIVREAFRTGAFAHNISLHIYPRKKAKEATMQDIQKEMKDLIHYVTQLPSKTSRYYH